MKRKILMRLAALTLLAAALFVLPPNRPAGAVTETCETQFNNCYQNCDGKDPVDQNPCRVTCQDGYRQCHADDYADDGGSNDPQQPQEPCQECLVECDLQQQICLYEGTYTPTQCAYTNYRCRQRCNYYCFL